MSRSSRPTSLVKPTERENSAPFRGRLKKSASASSKSGTKGSILESSAACKNNRRPFHDVTNRVNRSNNVFTSMPKKNGPMEPTVARATNDRHSNRIFVQGQDAFPTSVVQCQNENMVFSQLSESQASNGFGSVTLGQKSFSQPNSQNAASKFLPSHTFLARKMEAPPSSFSNASKTTTTAFRHLPPPPSHLTKTQPNFWSQQQAFGKDRASTFGASHAGRQYLLPPEFSSVGPTCSVPLMKPAAPPNAYSVFRFGQQNSHNSCSQIPASSCLLSHQDGNVQQSLLSNSQASSKFSNSCFSQSYAKGSRAKSFGTSQSQAFSSCSIDTAQIASITKEVSDAMENKAKLILDQLADKENIMDKKTQDWEMKLNQKGEFLFQQLDTKASDWDAKMTESMSTLATMNDTVKREVASFDSRVKASESMFKKHGRMLDEKAQEIHSLGSAMLKKIRNAGGEVIRGARDAGDLIRSSKTNIVSAFFECLDPTIANVLGRTGTALNSKPIPALSDSPAITFETDSKSDSELRIRSREMKSSPDSAKMSESLASPTMRGQCKRRSPHLNPLELIIKPSNAVIGSASKTQRQKRTKKFSSSTSFCITPSDNKRTDHGLSQKVFSKEYPSPLKDSTPPITVPEDKKRRRISSGNGKRRRRAMRLMDESQLGFSSFGAS